MSNVVLAIAKCPFTVFPGFTPKDAGQCDEESIRVKMLFDLLPQRQQGSKGIDKVSDKVGASHFHHPTLSPHLVAHFVDPHSTVYPEPPNRTIALL